MGKASRNKGKDGEREFASLCRDQGYNAYRTAQYKGKDGGEADVQGLPGVHIEVKRTERLNLRAAMEQAIRDSDGKALPIVAHRCNHAPWLITMLADDWFEIYREYEAGRNASDAATMAEEGRIAGEVAGSLPRRRR